MPSFTFWDFAMQSPPKLLTSGRIAELLEIPISQVRYILSTRPDIRPSAYAGNIRLYDRKALGKIRREVACDKGRGDAEGASHE
jgi:hypothetical protein